ncbi:glycosyltransferase family 4 protein [Pontibacter sp. MBLB2868]|uniref:glycosyltransferase family 4 protein n=1 Tax=Pontibacter sp. MBLB2868 TaxID=3451555 RepID=UPI003F752EB3
MKVLFVVPYPLGKAASQRFRVEQFLPLLQKHNVDYDLKPFWCSDAWALLYKEGYALSKLFHVIKGFLKRLLLLLQLPDYDYVYIHREATPVGPPWFEWIAANLLGKKLLFDFDDAIWLDNTSSENRLAAKYKWHSKTAEICRWSEKVSVGNKYLQEYATRFNKQVVCLPSTLDIVNRYNELKAQNTARTVIGWIGSHSTLPYLKIIEPVLQQLEEKYAFDFVVIADKVPELKLRSLSFVPWNPETEVRDLLQFNIGVMPLPDTEWAKGKCAFKAIQYMALGIPAVVSAVGANTEAVVNGDTGYTCTTNHEWYESLSRLLQDTALRTDLGLAGRAWVTEKYTMRAHEQTFISLFS